MRGEGRGCRSSSISGMNHCIHVTGVHGSSLSLVRRVGTLRTSTLRSDGRIMETNVVIRCPVIR